ncbi:MAG TPA: bifunctional nuclease family protein [Nitrospiraceae bacterium]
MIFTRLCRAGLVLLCMVSLAKSVGAAEKAPVTDLVTIADVKVRMTDHGPVVLLQAEGKAIPIFIDLTVALSIQAALNGEKLERPMSHDLMSQILRTYGGKVTQTVITLKSGTYYGALTVAVRDETKVFDSRSSDSIALAVHFKAPILVGRDLLNSAGRVLEKSKTEDL